MNSVFNGKRKMLRESLHHICSSANTETALSSKGTWPMSRWIGCPNDFQLANRILVGAQQAEREMLTNRRRGRHQREGRAARPQVIQWNFSINGRAYLAA